MNVPLEILTVGTELPLDIEVVPFQLGPALPLEEVPALRDTEAVGKGTNVPLEVPVIDAEPLLAVTEVVPFQLGPTLPLDERLGLADCEAVGNGTKLPLEILAVVTEPLVDADVVFQLGAALPLNELPELVEPEAVGKGTKLPLERLIVGIEPFPLDTEVVFQLGPTLEIAEPIEADTIEPDSVEGTREPVSMLLGAVRLEFHPVKVPVGRVPLSTGLDVKFPGTDHGSESLVVPDRVISDE
ncbi:hypothetical protein FBEOM_2617 [Fusarium beomiforme]|uniref:Uncharacterized protein n=1 Tax=Fusarium beomiforme TaxID=44412 RepID=A0A9P5ARA1_9HYPO|nr:hypothetical protein FBEOM_2617 [Fusarium beomiforme]